MAEAGAEGGALFALLCLESDVRFTSLSSPVPKEKKTRAVGELPSPAQARLWIFPRSRMETCCVVLSESSCRLRWCVRRKVTRAARIPGWWPTQGAPTFQVQPCRTLASWLLSWLHFHACGLTSLGQGASSRSPPLVKVFCVIPPVAWRILFFYYCFGF